MIEKEFKDLASSLELNSLDKKEINNFLGLVTDSTQNSLSKSLKINDFAFIPKIDNLNNYEKEFNTLVSVVFKTKTLPLELALEVSFNEIINGILLNMKNNLIYKDEMPVIEKDFNHQKLSITFSQYKVNFYLFFRRDNLIKSNMLTDKVSCFNDNLDVYLNFFRYCEKKYNRFSTALSLISKFRFDLKQNTNFSDYLIDAILLCYGLEAFDYEGSLIDYLKVYTHAINDLIEGKEIILSDNLYKEFNVLGNFTPKDNFKIIDISNKLNNLISEYDSLRPFKDLKSLIVSKFPKDGKVVTIDVTPRAVMKDATICWSFKILDTDVFNHGGEYELNCDNFYSCIYKAMLKGLQFVVKNKLGNNIIFNIENKTGISLKDAFPNPSIKGDMDKLSYENQSRYANVLNYVKDFDLGIEYKIK